MTPNNKVRSTRMLAGRLLLLGAVVVAGLIAAAGAAGQGASWSGSADSGFRQWAQVQDGVRNPGFGQTRVRIVRSPVLPGRKAFKFSSSRQPADNGPRAELVDSHEFTEGEEYWFGDVLYIPKRYRRWTDGHHTLMQFKNAGSGSPPLSLDVRNWGRGTRKRGLFVQSVTGGNEKYRLVVPSSRLYSRAVPIEIRVKFSSDSATGNFEVWVDGRRVVGPVRATTLYEGETSYFKQGQYGEAAGNVVYWHGAKRGPSRASVQR